MRVAAVLVLCTLHSASVCSSASSFTGAGVRGAALSGLTNMEDWFFNARENLPPPPNTPFDEVASSPTLPQGRFFPSDKVAAELIDPWFSVGDLVGTTSARLGDDVVIKAMTAHRESYITEFDFQAMAAAGLNVVRLPVGWWTFAQFPLPTQPGLVSDPCYPAKKFVTASGSWLDTLLAQGARYNISFLVDVHAMPCGSSDGTYRYYLLYVVFCTLLSTHFDRVSIQ